MFNCLLLTLATLTTTSGTGDAWCFLQKRPRPALVPSRVPDLWSTPGVGFRECPKATVLVETELHLESRLSNGSKTLPNKLQCPPGQVLIGDFTENAYDFSCCEGECGGCRSSKNGTCQKCAAGFVMQQIPVLEKSKCFICDDVPGFQDAHGRSCSDLKRQGLCSGSWPKAEDDLAFQGIRPSEACCECGGGSVYPTPVYMAFAEDALYFGQTVDETPQPTTPLRFWMFRSKEVLDGFYMFLSFSETLMVSTTKCFQHCT